MEKMQKLEMMDKI